MLDYILGCLTQSSRLIFIVMGFYLQKVISTWLYPLPISLLLIALGLILLILKHPKSSFYCALVGLLILILFSVRVFSFPFINSLQCQYQPLVNPPAGVTNIVVLGGGVSDGKSYPPNLKLRSASLSRLIEGIRLYHAIEKMGQTPKLLLSGGRVFQSEAEAGVMQNTALMLGIPAKNIVIEDGSKNTAEEAAYFAPILKQQPFILVTSAYHMPRSMMLFEAKGMHPIAAPTQFFSADHLKIKSYIPSSLSLELSDITIHEYLGMLWAKLTD